jgi:hypothetical protein
VFCAGFARTKHPIPLLFDKIPIKINSGSIRMRVIAAIASAPPHHLNSHAAQKPMMAKTAMEEI